MDVQREIKNTDVVKPSFDQFAQQTNDDTQPIELTNTTSTNIQDLNDDCLLEIFSIKSLTAMDLCCLAETCTHFKQIAQRVFPKKCIIEDNYSKFHLWVASTDNLSRGRTTHDVERILNNFGSCLTAFSIDGRYESPLDVVNLVTKYCSGTLEKLKIDAYLSIPYALAVKLKPIFQRLSLLDIGFVTIDGGRNLFANCDSLIELTVYSTGNREDILVNTFPKLERLKLFSHYGGGTVYSPIEQLLLNFISRHQTLKTLNFKMKIRREYKHLFLQAIRNCKKLEELAIGMLELNKDFFSVLQSLDQLRQLDIGMYENKSTDCIVQLQALKSLETLKIEIVAVDLQLFPALSQMKNLRELYLYDLCGLRNTHQLTLLTQLKKLYLSPVGGFDDLIDIIRHLANLEELTIDDMLFVLDEKTLSRIVDIVKGRPKVLTLKCNFDFLYNLSNCNETRKLRLV